MIDTSIKKFFLLQLFTLKPVITKVSIYINLNNILEYLPQIL